MNSASRKSSAICPHSLTNRSLVLDGPVNFELVRGEEVIVTTDGQQIAPVKAGQRITVKKSELKTNLIRLKEYDFFGRVKKTFGFAAGD